MKALGLLLASMTVLPAATLYSIGNLGGLGGASATAYRINASGMVAGWALLAAGDQHAVLWSGGIPQDLTPGSPSAMANSINNSGSAAGFSYIGGEPHGMIWSGNTAIDLGAGVYANRIGDDGAVVGGNGHAFLYAGGIFQDLGTLLGGNWSSAADRNTAGSIIGDAMTAGGNFRGFVWTPTTGMVALGTFGGTDSHATAMNDAGQIVGSASLPNGYLHAFRTVAGGPLIDLGTLGGASSLAYDVNQSGSIVGRSWLGSGSNTHAFLWLNGVMLDLNSLIPPGSGWELTDAYGINDAGQIVGSGLLQGKSQAYLLDPVRFSAQPLATPEPGTLGLMALALAILFPMHVARSSSPKALENQPSHKAATGST